MRTKTFDIRAALLKSAKKEFLAHGFEKASLRKICDGAHVTTGAFYARFSGKAALFDALVEDTVAGFHEMYNAVIRREMNDLDASTENELKSIEFLTAHRDAFRLLFECAKGTKYEHFKDELVENIFDKTYQRFFDHYAGKKVDPALVKIIVRMKFQEYMELAYGGYSAEEVRRLIVRLSAFTEGGFRRLIGFLNEETD